jgi:hypothetical protein
MDFGKKFHKKIMRCKAKGLLLRLRQKYYLSWSLVCVARLAKAFLQRDCW